MTFFSTIKRKINGLIRRGYWYNNILFPDCSKFTSLREFNLDVVNLGSTSGVCSFNYDGLTQKGMNWALTKNPLLADEEVLKNYFSYLKPQGSVVIVTLCPFSSLSGSYDYFDDRYYSFLNIRSIPHFSIAKKQEVLRKMESPLEYYPLSQLFYGLKRCIVHRKRNTMTADQMKSDAVSWLEGWKKEFSISSFSRPLSIVNHDGIADASRILNEIIVFCKEREIRPVFLIPPVYQSLADLLTQQIRELVIEPLLSMLKDQDVWFHNYMDDEAFTDDISLFQNSFLMNEKGAKLFTKRVLTDIGLIEG